MPFDRYTPFGVSRGNLTQQEQMELPVQLRQQAMMNGMALNRLRNMGGQNLPAGQAAAVQPGSGLARPVSQEAFDAQRMENMNRASQARTEMAERRATGALDREQMAARQVAARRIADLYRGGETPAAADNMDLFSMAGHVNAGTAYTRGAAAVDAAQEENTRYNQAVRGGLEADTAQTQFERGLRNPLMASQADYDRAALDRAREWMENLQDPSTPEATAAIANMAALRGGAPIGEAYSVVRGVREDLRADERRSQLAQELPDRIASVAGAAATMPQAHELVRRAQRIAGQDPEQAAIMVEQASQMVVEDAAQYLGAMLDNAEASGDNWTPDETSRYARGAADAIQNLANVTGMDLNAVVERFKRDVRMRGLFGGNWGGRSFEGFMADVINIIRSGG